MNYKSNYKGVNEERMDDGSVNWR